MKGWTTNKLADIASKAEFVADIAHAIIGQGPPESIVFDSLVINILRELQDIADTLGEYDKTLNPDD